MLLKLRPAGAAPLSAKLSVLPVSTSVAVTAPLTMAASSATLKLAACATGASLMPLTVTTTVRGVPSALVTTKLSVTLLPAGRA